MRQNNYNGSLQKPVGSGFGKTSTSKDVIEGINLEGKVAILTGGYNGLGLNITKTLTAAGATVIIPAKDSEKARIHLQGINDVELESLDLTDPGSIDAFAEKFLATGRPLHLLINNAGIMWTPLQRDSRGYEGQFSTNHLGHFQLTARLWPALKGATGARVINVSSSGHYFSPIQFEDVNYKQRDYNKFEAYGQSKTANILFSLELDHRGNRFGVRAYSLHPGLILETSLGRHLTFDDYIAMGVLNADGSPNPEADAASKSVQKTISQGAATAVWAATSPQLANLGGVYLEDAEVAGFDPDFYNSGDWQKSMFGLKGVAPFALDRNSALNLWKLSEELTNIEFSVS